MNLPVLQDCAPYRAKVSRESCARRWRMAQQNMATAEGYMACRTCEVGKANAADIGEQPVNHERARDCVICGIRYVPRNFSGYARACSPRCKCQLMREAAANSTSKQRLKAKTKRKAVAL